MKAVALLLALLVVACGAGEAEYESVDRPRCDAHKGKCPKTD